MKKRRLKLLKLKGYSKNRKRLGLFKCKCGNTKTIIVASVNSGNTKSCGCLDRETRETRSLKHGLSKTSIWNRYAEIIQRCINKKCKSYKWYGGRGITVCKRWCGKNGFLNFVCDLGPIPGASYSIDRINNNKGYAPGNCRWATRKEQSLNKKATLYIKYCNKRLPLKIWSGVLKIRYITLYQRLYSYNWSIEKAFNTKVQQRNK